MMCDPYYYMAYVVGGIQNFSLAIGPASVTPLVIAGFFSGALSDNFNRRNILGLSLIIGSGLCASLGAATMFW